MDSQSANESQSANPEKEINVFWSCYVFVVVFLGDLWSQVRRRRAHTGNSEGEGGELVQ